MKKTKLDHLYDLLNSQEARIVACEVDLTVYNRKLLVIKDEKTEAFFKQKISELESIKARSIETVDIIKKMIGNYGKSNKNKAGRDRIISS
jgi:hypothetical protein